MWRRLRELGQVRFLHLLDPKATLPDQSWNVPRQIQALEQPVMNWLQALLPALYRRFGWEPEFKEDKLPVWSQDTPNASNSLHDARNRTQRKGANNRVNGAVRQGDTFPRKVEKLDVQLRSMPLLFCETYHSWIGFKRVELAHSCGIVVNEIRARTYTDLEHFSLSQRDDLLANFSDGRRVAQPIHKIGVDMISVEGHRYLDQGKIVDWPALAVDLGYFDQAYFIKDFKR
jgi:hypothetical protein